MASGTPPGVTGGLRLSLSHPFGWRVRRSRERFYTGEGLSPSMDWRQAEVRQWQAYWARMSSVISPSMLRP